MKNTFLFFIAVLGIAALTAACPKISSFMVRRAALEKSSCFCTDKTCVEKAINDFLEIGAVIKKETPDSTPEDTRKLSRYTITILAASQGKVYHR